MIALSCLRWIACDSSPGAGCTIDVKYTAAWRHNANDYCPGCVVQLYYGLTDIFRTGVVKSGIRNHSGKSSTSFVAPVKMGTYYITQAISLDYNYVGGTHPNTFANSLAVIRVQNPVTVTHRRLAWAATGNSRLVGDAAVGVLPMEIIDQVGELVDWERVCSALTPEQIEAEVRQASAYFVPADGVAGGGGEREEKGDKCIAM